MFVVCTYFSRNQENIFYRQKLESSAFALHFTEISVVWVAEISVGVATEISVTHTTEISVKSSAKADETSY